MFALFSERTKASQGVCPAVVKHNSLHGPSAAHRCVSPSGALPLVQSSTAVCASASPAAGQGSACCCLGGCSTSQQLCAVLGGSQVTAKSGFKREERKVRAMRPLVCTDGSGAGSHRCHLPQHPPPAGPPAKQSQWQMLALNSLLLSEAFISVK